MCPVRMQDCRVVADDAHFESTRQFHLQKVLGFSQL